MSFWQWLASVFRTPVPVAVADAATAGPSLDEHPFVSGRDMAGANWGGRGFPPGAIKWESGWWRGAAARAPMHPGRIGGVIRPQAVVVHTTDTLPGTSPAIIKSWTTQKGAGNGAHFLISRTLLEGTTQFCPITRNANHAGRGGHWMTAENLSVHPNTCSIGIELEGAGRLTAPKVPGGNPVHPDTLKELPRADCHYHEGTRTWWHTAKPWQLEELGRLVGDILPLLADFAPGTRIAPHGGYLANGVPWAEVAPSRIHVVGHATLDPYNKNDPGPQLMGWIREHW